MINAKMQYVTTWHGSAEGLHFANGAHDINGPDQQLTYSEPQPPYCLLIVSLQETG